MTRDRIVDIVTARAGDLVPNPRNWRTHPETQRRGLEQLLDTVGSVDVLKAVRLPDGRLQLVDGHLRAEIRQDEEVRVAVLDLTPEEADLVLATFDPVSAMAVADQEMLDALIRDLDVVRDTSPELFALLESLQSLDVGETPDLDDVGEEHGEEPDEKLSWKWVKIHLPPEVFADFMQLLDACGERDEVEKVRQLVSRVRLSEGEF